MIAQRLHSVQGSPLSQARPEGDGVGRGDGRVPGLGEELQEQAVQQLGGEQGGGAAGMILARSRPEGEEGGACYGGSRRAPQGVIKCSSPFVRVDAMHVGSEPSEHASLYMCTCVAASYKSIPVKSVRIYLRCCACESTSQEVYHTLDPGVGRRSDHP